MQPTGVVTFLFTDIEGSSTLWDAHGRDMADAMRLHDRIVGRTIESHGGYIFTTAGDSFAAAFGRPEGAAEAALEVHASLAAADWGRMKPLKVRVGMHTGTADERDGDYFGPTLNRAARLTDLANGTQTIMSLSTEELLRDDLNPQWHIKDLGRYHLKDLARPEQVFQLSATGGTLEFPPLRAAARTPNNLPTMLSSFIGRSHELERLTLLLGSTRLLTITGVGGSGKSRLGLRIAELSTETYPDGVWFVELAPLTDPDDIPSAVATAMGLDRVPLPGADTRPGSSATDLILRSVGAGHTLIVLDNCEHLTAGAAQWVGEVLRGCPHLTVIATSREGLGLSGETLWQVPPLAIGSEGGAETGECVDLFLERAREVGFALGREADSEVTTIGEICRRLDGIPLAVELAAVQTSIMTPAQVLARLSERFDLLTGGTRAALARHQTLEATVDWSYQLLSESEREVFAGLAVFRGGFTLEAAESVLDAHATESVVSAVRHLADKSMIQFDRSRGRFTLLETMRQFGLRRMLDTAAHDRLRRRHLKHFADYAERLWPLLFSADEIAAAHALLDDHDNMRISIDFGLANRLDSDVARVLAGIAPMYVVGGGDRDEWLDYLDRVDLGGLVVDAETQLRLLAYGCVLAGRSRPDAALAYFDRLDEIASSSTHSLARSWRAAAWLDAMPFDGVEGLFDAAQEWAEEAERASHKEMLGWAHMAVAVFARRMGKPDEAHDALDLSLAAFNVSGEPYGLASAHHQLGHLSRNSGDFVAAIDHYERGIERLETETHALLLAYLMGSKALVQSVLGDVAASLDSLAMVEQTLTGQSVYSLAEAFSLVASIKAAAGEEEAARAACLSAINDPYIDAEGFFDAAIAVLTTCEGSDEDRARILGWLDGADRQIMPIDHSVIEHQKRPAILAAVGSRLPELLEQGRDMSIPDLQSMARRVVEQSPNVSLQWEV